MHKDQGSYYNTGKQILLHCFLIMSFVFLPLLESSQTQDPVLLPRLLSLSIAFNISLIFILFSLIYNKNTIRRVLSHPIFLLYLLYLVLNLISLGQCYNLSEGIFEISKLVNNLISLLVLVYLLQDEPIKRIKLFCTYICVFALISSFIAYIQIPRLPSDDFRLDLVVGKFTNANLLSSVLLLTLPFIFIKILLSKRNLKVLYLIGLVFTLTLIFIIHSFAVIAALFITLAIGGILMIILGRKYFSVSGFWVNVLRFCFIGVSILVIGGALYFYPKYTDYLKNIIQTQDASGEKYDSFAERVLLWKKTSALIQDAPWLGVGPGNWKLNIPAYQLYGGILDTGRKHFRTPHNDFLWISAETGILGLFAFLLLLGCIIWLILKNLETQALQKNIILALVLLAFLAYLLVSLVSFPKERIMHQLFWCLILAVVIVLDRTDYFLLKSGKVLYPTWVFIFCSAVWVSWHSYQRYSAEILANRIHQAKKEKDWMGLLRLSQKIDPAIYNVDTYLTPVYLNQGIAHFQLGQEKEALASFEKAYEAHPYHPFVLTNLGTSHQLAGDTKKAIIFYHKALKISPYFQDALRNLAVIYYQEGRTEESYQTILKAKEPIERKILLAILNKLLQELGDSREDKGLAFQKKFQQLKDHPTQLLKLHQYAVKHNISFKKAFSQQSIRSD